MPTADEIWTAACRATARAIKLDLEMRGYAAAGGSVPAIPAPPIHDGMRAPPVDADAALRVMLRNQVTIMQAITHGMFTTRGNPSLAQAIRDTDAWMKANLQ